VDLRADGPLPGFPFHRAVHDPIRLRSGSPAAWCPSNGASSIRSIRWSG
jgi:hypothetical protein